MPRESPATIDQARHHVARLAYSASCLRALEAQIAGHPQGMEATLEVAASMRHDVQAALERGAEALDREREGWLESLRVAEQTLVSLVAWEGQGLRE